MDLKLQAELPGQEQSLLQGVNVLLQGPTGVGKTFALGTLVDTGLEVFYVGFESGIESLLGYWTDRGKPVPANLHWHQMRSSDYGFESMIKSATDINTYTNEALTKIQDPNKQKHNQFITFLKLLNNFEDQRTGKAFGGVDKWGPDRCLAIDALTGINSAVMSLVVGAKPIRSFTDWGIAMDQIERLLLQLSQGCKCHFVLIAHVERETDQTFGGVKITVGTLGQKLAPKIPPMFSDVILAYRQGKEFSWSTINPMADLKTRNLPLSDKIEPSFKNIIEKWQSRGGKFTSTVRA